MYMLSLTNRYERFYRFYEKTNGYKKLPQNPL